ncbi:MAG TPA: hypothetical protein VFD92_04875 [Candidatus Binatia bacterium]|nr:hypothetical protein [Candidatus Binatia bacterium]
MKQVDEFWAVVVGDERERFAMDVLGGVALFRTRVAADAVRNELGRLRVEQARVARVTVTVEEVK